MYGSLSAQHKQLQLQNSEHNGHGILGLLKLALLSTIAEKTSRKKGQSINLSSAETIVWIHVPVISSLHSC